MPEIRVRVRGRQAEVSGAPVVVCGNSDYTVQFDLDGEWDAFELKTARFAFQTGGVPVYQDVLFRGDACAVPVLRNTYELAVGLYAGNIRTTAPALIPCARCVTDDGVPRPDPAPDVYEQLLALLRAAQTDSAPPPGSAALCAAGFVTGAAGSAESEEI